MVEIAATIFVAIIVLRILAMAIDGFGQYTDDLKRDWRQPQRRHRYHPLITDEQAAAIDRQLRRSLEREHAEVRRRRGYKW
jgi:hypothetical protein